jgi:hypothetical protein
MRVDLSTACVALLAVGVYLDKREICLEPRCRQPFSARPSLPRGLTAWTSPSGGHARRPRSKGGVAMPSAKLKKFLDENDVRYLAI